MKHANEARASARSRYSCRYTSSYLRVFIHDSQPPKNECPTAVPDRGLQIAAAGSSQERRKYAMSDTSQFNINRTYPGRWTITFSNPPINVFVPTTIVDLGTLMTD